MMSNRPYDFAGLADFAVERLVAISVRASRLARGIGLMAAAAGALAYAVGLFASPTSFRLAWAIVGIIPCGSPALAVFVALRRLRRVRTTAAETAAELRSVLNDQVLLGALRELVDHDETERGTGRDGKAALVKIGRELNDVRKAASSHRAVLANAWQSITALTTLPALIAFATMGAFALFAFSAIAVVVRLVLLAG